MSLIQQRTIERVTEQASIVEVVSDFVQLKAKGSNWVGLSPFVEEKTPSFVVSPSKNIYKCFSSGKSGGPIKFLQEKEAMDFPDAIKYLADKYHILVEYDSNADPEEFKKKQEAKKSLTDVMVHAVTKYSTYFNALPDKHPAKDHVYNYRKLSPDDVIQWQIGYCPKGSLLRQDFVETGLTDSAKHLFLISEQGSFDNYQDRIIFPLQDANDNYIGLAGRTLNNDGKYAKFLNPKDSDIYQKQKTLYGLNFAKKSIREKNLAYLVEGYNDVIAFHKHGLDNTVASCGTSITDQQIKLLNRYSGKVGFKGRVCIVFDNDDKPNSPGQKRAFEQIDLFLKQGFDVSLSFLPLGDDPDSFCRNYFYQESINHFGLEALLKEVEQDAVPYKCRILWMNASSVSAKAEALKEICQLISLVSDPFARRIYIDTICKEFDVNKTDVKREIDALASKIQQDKPQNQFGKFEDQLKSDHTLPKYLEAQGLKWEDVREDVVKYHLFCFKNAIYSRRGKDGSYYFEEVSNFKIRVIQHMEDEKIPRKLIEIVNVHNRRRVFDCRSDDFITSMSFRKMVTGRGNYQWTGTEIDFGLITGKLMDEMGDGRMITQLGWQPEGFWAFNNLVVIDDKLVNLDPNGCFDYSKTSYYIPSGNSINANNPLVYQPQKRVAHVKQRRSLDLFLQQLTKVHRQHSYNAILFTMASVFNDIIFDRLTFFPLLFLYGEPSSGKDNLIECCLSFFGKPQEAVSLSGKANTDKGKIRKFAEFTNMIVYMSEYVNGNNDGDQMLKGVWDRTGYTRGTIESSVGTESVPILCSLILSGNEYPYNDALITRILAEEMDKDEFTQAEKDEYEILKEWTKEGLSGYLPDILRHRTLFKTNFRKMFKEVSAQFKADLRTVGFADRMPSNASVLGATYILLQDHVAFPFTYEQWFENAIKGLTAQQDKRVTGSALTKFWDCFLAGCKGIDPLKHGVDFKIENNVIWFNLKSVYLKYTVIHYNLFRDKGLSMSGIITKLKKSKGWVGEKNSIRFGPKSKSSAFGHNLDKTGIKHELLSITEAYNEPNVADPLAPKLGVMEIVEDNAF